MNLIFYRTKQCIVNYFVWGEFNGQQLCFCNWNVLTGPAAGVYNFTGLPTTYFNQLTALGILFCPSEAVKIKRILSTPGLSQFTIV